MAAPKGNKFYKLALRMTGRPRKYETIEDLQREIVAYFEEQDSLRKPKYTITGLTAWLGFSNRADLYLQCDRGEDFSRIIKEAVNIVASCYEENLHGMSPAGSIFALKNIKSSEFKDKIEVDQTTTNITWEEKKTYAAESKADHSS